MVATAALSDASSERNTSSDRNNDSSKKLSQEVMDGITSFVQLSRDASSLHAPRAQFEPDGSITFGNSGGGDTNQGGEGSIKGGNKQGEFGNVGGESGNGGNQMHNGAGGESGNIGGGIGKIGDKSGQNDDPGQVGGAPDSPYASDGVDQGGHGDCVFEATLAANAKTGNLQNLIKTNPDGSYTVTFPGDPTHPVNVTQSDIDQANVRDSADWAKILETAMIKQYPDFAKGGGHPDDAPGGTDGKPPTPAQYAMYLLTGNTAPKVDATDSGAGDRIQQALDNGQPVVAFCKDNDHGALVSGHEWTVEKYDPATGQITVRNPWGSNPNSDSSKSGVTNLGDGEVQMSLQTFQKYYGEVTFGTAPETASAPGPVNMPVPV
jgi:hypothetical protein